MGLNSDADMQVFKKNGIRFLSEIFRGRATDESVSFYEEQLEWMAKKSLLSVHKL